MGNGKITKELKGLGTTINGKEPSGETVSEVIKGINDDYEGGGSGATYTAGNGIAITDENVINADIKVLEVSNITTLTTEQCNSLNAGDVVVKLTSNQKHTYTVSYKENNVGMCLTYVDASVSETVSYDCVDGNWVYNSTDVTQLGGSGKTYTAGTGISITNENVINNTQDEVIANPTLAGTEANLTGLQVGETKYAVPQGGSDTKLYNVDVRIDISPEQSCNGSYITFIFNTLDITDLPTNFEELVSHLTYNENTKALYILAHLSDFDNVFNKNNYDGYIIISLAYNVSVPMLRIVFLTDFTSADVTTSLGDITVSLDPYEV